MVDWARKCVWKEHKQSEHMRRERAWTRVESVVQNCEKKERPLHFFGTFNEKSARQLHAQSFCAANPPQNPFDFDELSSSICGQMAAACGAIWPAAATLVAVTCIAPRHS